MYSNTCECGRRYMQANVFSKKRVTTEQVISQTNPDRVVICPTLLLDNQSHGLASFLRSQQYALVNTLPSFYGTRSSIAVFTRARYLFLSQSTWIHSTTSCTVSLLSILILFPHIRMSFKVVAILQILYAVPYMHMCSLLCLPHAPPISSSLLWWN